MAQQINYDKELSFLKKRGWTLAVHKRRRRARLINPQGKIVTVLNKYLSLVQEIAPQVHRAYVAEKQHEKSQKAAV